MLPDSLELFTAQELGERLRIKPGTVLSWYRAGRIPARKLSAKILRSISAMSCSPWKAARRPDIKGVNNDARAPTG